MISKPPALRSLACGATVATLVFFPLLNALATEHGYWLHWRTQDTLETLVAWAALGAIVFATLAVPVALERPRVAEAANFGWLLIGGYFVMGGLVKTAAIWEFASAHRAAAASITVALLLVLVVAAAMIWITLTRRGGRPVEKATLALAPLVAVFAWQLGSAQWHHLEPPPAAVQAELGGRPGVRTLVLLFDELSPDYLYGDRAAILQQLPALRRFIGEATVYGAAYLPGGETRLAIPALFAPAGPGGAQALAVDVPPPAGPARGWVGQAVARGFDVRVFGWHLDYCTGIAAAANECLAVSLYNRRTLGGGFSLANPFLTMLCLLPADFPFGWAKDVPARRLHLDTSALAGAWLAHQMVETRADVVYVHVNVPHVPFLDERLEGQERFVVTPERYVAQLRVVDAFLASALEVVARSGADSRQTRVILMSDHNARSLTPKAEHERVVFAVREPGRGDGDGDRDDRRVRASEMLARYLLSASGS